MNEEEKYYKFYKYENNKYGSDYCFCERPCDDNMSLCCFLDNGEILGFMSESLVNQHKDIKEISMSDFMYYFVRPLIKENKRLKENWNKLKEILNKEIKDNEKYDKKNNCEWQGYNFYYKILKKMQELEKEKK